MGLMDRLRRARRTAEEDAAKEKLRKWRNDMRKEMRQMDREIRKIEMQQKPVIKSIKAAAKRGDMDSARLLAKEIVRSRKAVARLQLARAQAEIVRNQCMLHISQRTALSALERSAEIMGAVNKMVSITGATQTIREMESEMVKAGILSEMVDEAMDDAMIEVDDELGEAADEEVEKVFTELASKVTSKLPSVPRATAATMEAALAVPGNNVVLQRPERA